MTARRYALLDPTQLGAQLELRDGREVVTFDTDSTTAARHVRADIGAASGQHAFAVALWGDQDLAAGEVYIGVATPDASLAAYVGNTGTDSIGYDPAAGSIVSGGSAIQTGLPTAGKRQRITVEVDLDADPQTIRWLVDGLEVAADELPEAAATWYPAITVSGATAYELSALFTGGRRAGEIASVYDWGEDLPGIGNLDLAPVFLDYRTGPTDTPANTAFIGDILNAGDVAIRSRVRFWPLGDEEAAVPGGTVLRLQNQEGRYDSLLAFDGRGARVRLYDGRHGDDFASQRLVATLQLDSVRAATGDVIELHLASPLRRLEQPWQQRLLPPWLDEAVRNRPWPVAIGAVRNVPPLYVDRVAGYPQYLAHDRELAVAQVRDGGDPLEEGASPPTFVLIDGGIQLDEDPQKLLTLDASGAAAVEVPEAAPDELGGDGAFETETAGMPDGWAEVGDGSVTRIGSPGAYALRIESGSNAFDDHAFYYATAVMDRGKRYRLVFDVLAVGGEDYPSVGQYAVRYACASFPGPTSSFGRVNINGVGRYELTLEFPSSGPSTALPVFKVESTETNPNNVTLTIANVELFELADPPSIGADSLEGVGLAEYITQVLDRVNGEAVDWVPADAEAIDDATGYQIGAWLYDAGSTFDALRHGLRAFTADVTQDEQGRLRVARLVAPEDVAEVDLDFDIAVDQHSIEGNSEPLPELLSLPGFTTSYGVRRNWAVMQPGDFVADTDPVTGVPLNVRTQFQRASQRILQASGSLAAAYLAGDRADVLNTVHEDPTLAQDEADRIAAFCARPRWIIRQWRIVWPDDVPLLRAGMVGRITHPRWGFAAGRNVLILDCDLYPWAQAAVLTVIY